MMSQKSGDCRVMCMWSLTCHNSDVFLAFFERCSTAKGYDPGECIPHLGGLGRRLDGEELSNDLPFCAPLLVLPYPSSLWVIFGRLSEGNSGGLLGCTSLASRGKRSGWILALWATPPYHRWAVFRNNTNWLCLPISSAIEKMFIFSLKRFKQHNSMHIWCTYWHVHVWYVMYIIVLQSIA